MAREWLRESPLSTACSAQRESLPVRRPRGSTGINGKAAMLWLECWDSKSLLHSNRTRDLGESALCVHGVSIANPVCVWGRSGDSRILCASPDLHTIWGYGRTVERFRGVRALGTLWPNQASPRERKKKGMHTFYTLKLYAIAYDHTRTAQTRTVQTRIVRTRTMQTREPYRLERYKRTKSLYTQKQKDDYSDRKKTFSRIHECLKRALTYFRDAVRDAQCGWKANGSRSDLATIVGFFDRILFCSYTLLAAVDAQMVEGICEWQTAGKSSQCEESGVCRTHTNCTHRIATQLAILLTKRPMMEIFG